MNNNKSKTSNKNTKSSKNKNGFTLIELLVVVLIIGILAAIVLPMYQTAVAKAKLSELVTVTKSLADAEERFYMINSAYGKISSLDIELPSSDYSCYIDGANMSPAYNWSNVFCWTNEFVVRITLQNASPTNRNAKGCSANTQDVNSPKAKACTAFIGKKVSAFTNSFVCGNDTWESSSCVYSESR